MSNYHTPVLLKETMEFLNIQKDSWYIDATLGGGGHTEEILKKGGKVIGIDQDPDAINAVKTNLSKYSDNLILQQGNFSELKSVIAQQKAGGVIAIRQNAGEAISKNKTDSGSRISSLESPQDSLQSGMTVSGILFDLGVSSHQLDTPERGFSFSKDAPLDMRMNPTFGATAADLINGLHEGELAELFEKLGEERFAKRIAKKIVETRKSKKIETTSELANIVRLAIHRPRSSTSGVEAQIHPATKVFQALRIAVNDELNALKESLPQALDLLSPGGRLVVISFHSLEDRIVKNFYKDAEAAGTGKILTPKPIMATLDEQYDNPRSRSAKLRTIVKL